MTTFSENLRGTSTNQSMKMLHQIFCFWTKAMHLCMSCNIFSLCQPSFD